MFFYGTKCSNIKFKYISAM